MPRRQGPNHSGHTNNAHRQGARGGSDAAARGGTGHSEGTVGPGDVGVGKGTRQASGVSSGASRTPRRPGDKLSRPAALHPARDIESAQARFLATVSHELRTPLTALAGYQELFADNVLGPLSDQ